MVGPSSPKAPHSLHISSMKSSSSSSSSSMSSMKLKTLLQTFIFSHLYRIARALTKAKSILIELLKDIHFLHFLEFPLKKNRSKNKLILGSFRLHYNWCSSHVMPVPVLEGSGGGGATNHLSYHDSSWNSSITPSKCGDGNDDDDILPDESQLSSYLQWLEEKGKIGNISKRSTTCTDDNEIDRLADMFIASCHEKFRLEKVESYRRFQEMMARSV